MSEQNPPAPSSEETNDERKAKALPDKQVPLTRASPASKLGLGSLTCPLILCLGIFLFLTAAAIVLSLIPLYIPNKSVPYVEQTYLLYPIWSVQANTTVPTGPLNAAQNAYITTELTKTIYNQTKTLPKVETLEAIMRGGQSKSLNRRRRNRRIILQYYIDATCRVTYRSLIRKQLDVETIIYSFNITIEILTNLLRLGGYTVTPNTTVVPTIFPTNQPITTTSTIAQGGSSSTTRGPTTSTVSTTQGPTTSTGSTTQGPTTSTGSTTQGPTTSTGSTTQGPTTSTGSTTQGPTTSTGPTSTVSTTVSTASPTQPPITTPPPTLSTIETTETPTETTETPTDTTETPTDTTETPTDTTETLTDTTETVNPSKAPEETFAPKTAEAYAPVMLINDASSA